MVTRRNLIKGSALVLAWNFVPFGNLLADESIYKAPYIEDCYGIKDRCAKYARLVSEKEFNKYFVSGPAWTSAERNNCLIDVSMNHEYLEEKLLKEAIEENILQEGMIVGAHYGHSKWNGKFYTPDGKVWAKHGGKWRRFRSNGVNKKEILLESKESSLEKIRYSHLMCYAGQDKNGELVFWHQFPYWTKNGVKIFQKSIKASNLKTHHLYPMSIIDAFEKSIVESSSLQFVSP